MGGLDARYSESLPSTEIGVRFGVRCGPNYSQIIAALAVKNGASGSGRTDDLSLYESVALTTELRWLQIETNFASTAYIRVKP